MSKRLQPTELLKNLRIPTIPRGSRQKFAKHKRPRRVLDKARHAPPRTDQDRIPGSARLSLVLRGGAGDIRLVVYATALYTWLRPRELNEICWSDFFLDDAKPRVRAPASISMNRKEALLPLHLELAAILRQFRSGDFAALAKPFRHHVPRMKTVRRDLERAGIPLREEQGRRVDFHSLRMTFGTTMLASGVHPIVVKKLMRHSDLKLTTNLYTDSSQLPLAAGVAMLPGFATSQPKVIVRNAPNRKGVRMST